MELKEMQAKIVAFRDKRDWKQFHNFKDLAISLVLEAGEVLEHAQWKTKEEFEEFLASEKFGDLEDEIIDVLYWLLLISHDYNIDIEKAFNRKMEKNDKKYPVEKASGNHKKYTEL